MLSIRGNTDRYFFGEDGKDDAEKLPPGTMPWLRALPATAIYGDQILLSHGTPASDEVYWLDRETREGFRAATTDEIIAQLPEISVPLFCCGHTHVARIVHLPDGRIVFNPGSVGRPSFNMGDPASAFRAGPQAEYAIVTKTGDTFSIDLRQVSYDHQAAARLARDNGAENWAQDLMVGRRR
jgi:diadenosine tetraphosphatase ApaH/serine/threonine PP2A family protein phosphatase